MNNQMMKYLFHILLLTCVTISTGINDRRPESCDPFENCEKAKVIGAQVRDPVNCHSYYVCLERTKKGRKVLIPSDHSVPCPDGQDFKPGHPSGECVKESTPCISPCVQRNCNVECSQVDNLESIAYPGDCTKYYNCIGGKKYEAKCEEGMAFNGVKCEPNHFDKCCALCEPWCEEAFSEVRDPYDCNSFYFCNKGPRVPEKESKFGCKEGQFFDAQLGQCQPNKGRCSNLCPAH